MGKPPVCGPRGDLDPRNRSGAPGGSADPRPDRGGPRGSAPPGYPRFAL